MTTVPYSLGDLVDAIDRIRRLVRGLVEDASEAVTTIGQLARQRQRSKAATDVSSLGFGPSGMVGPLQRIASGRGTANDMTMIKLRLGETAKEVETSMQNLRYFRNHVSRHFGERIAMNLDQLIDGPLGKGDIRFRLNDLLGMKARGKRTQESAKRILDTISAFNRQMADFHDRICPPTMKA